MKKIHSRNRTKPLPLPPQKKEEQPTMFYSCSLSFCAFSVVISGLELKYVAADIGTNPPSTGTKSFAACAIEKMTEMRDGGSIAFIGPDDTCISEALVAAAWNLPMISYVSNVSRGVKLKAIQKFLSFYMCKIVQVS